MCPNGLNELTVTVSPSKTEEIVNILSHAEIQTVKMEENKKNVFPCYPNICAVSLHGFLNSDQTSKRPNLSNRTADTLESPETPNQLQTACALVARCSCGLVCSKCLVTV